MNESSFKQSIIKKLKGSGVYAEAMANDYRGGTPDHYYEGPNGVLWVEYKWNNAAHPRKMMEPTALQDLWLVRAFGNGVQVALAMGSPFLVYICTEPPFGKKGWSELVPRAVLTEWIKRKVL